MPELIRSEAVRYERHLIYFAALAGGLALYGGLGLTLTGLILTPNPLANSTGVMGAGLLALAAAYLLSAVALARTRSVVAWGVLMLVFVLLATVGTALISPGSVVPGLTGLYIGYRAATDAGYELPVVGSVGA